MLDNYLVQTCELITTSIDDFGQRIYASAATLNCRWRDIPSVQRDSHHESSSADSMVWFAADEVVTKGSILRFDGNYYEVERITKARKLGGTAIQFLKCDVSATIIGVS